MLVTGGAGYIGSVLIGRLLANGYTVRTIDRLAFGDYGLKPHLSKPGFTFIKADICDHKNLSKAISGVSTVVHLAAVVGDPACKKFPEEAVRTNKEGAEILCRMALESGVHRFIFASTCSNYGKMADPNGYVDETSPLAPVSLYAELKVGFEKYLMEQKPDSFSPVILRFATAYGLSPRPRFDLTVNEFARDLTLGKRLDVYGEQFWRPYCHTTDLAEAVILAMEAEATSVAHEIFNVGDTTENYQKKTLVEMILDELPRMREKVRFVGRDEDPRDYRVNFDKIKTKLTFAPRKKVIDGIRECIHAIQNGLIDDPENSRYRNI